MKQKRIKSQKYVSEDTKQFTNLLLITLGVALVVVGLYFLTDRVLSKKNAAAIKFDYDVCTVGTMFNRPYDEYYVFLYDSTSDNAATYNSLVSNYIAKEDAKKLYTVDLSKNLDSKYLSDTSNDNPSTPAEVKIKDSALVLIKNGKVSSYFEKDSDYEEVLK